MYGSDSLGPGFTDKKKEHGSVKKEEHGSAKLYQSCAGSRGCLAERAVHCPFAQDADGRFDWRSLWPPLHSSDFGGLGGGVTWRCSLIHPVFTNGQEWCRFQETE